MKLSTRSAALAFSVLAASMLHAQSASPWPAPAAANDEQQEFALTVGTLSGSSPSPAGGPLTLGTGLAFEADFAQRVKTLKWANLYVEADGLINPFRHLTGSPAAATDEIRSVYITPGARLQFLPKEVLSPWIALGGGVAIYDARSTSVSGGQTGNGVGKDGGANATGAVDFGVGVDFKTTKHYIIRGDVRGFYTGSPNFGVPNSGGQFNFVVGGGFVWRFTK